MEAIFIPCFRVGTILLQSAAGSGVRTENTLFFNPHVTAGLTFGRCARKSTHSSRAAADRSS